jgi:hypothetical protein
MGKRDKPVGKMIDMQKGHQTRRARGDRSRREDEIAASTSSSL